MCGQTNCDVEWPYEEVCKMALLTPEEMEYFEEKLFSRVTTDYLDFKLVSILINYLKLCLETTFVSLKKLVKKVYFKKSLYLFSQPTSFNSVFCGEDRPE